MKRSRLVFFILACMMIITICACGSEAVSEVVIDNTDETADNGAANEYKANSGDTMTINLKNNGDGKSHYAIVSVSTV